MQFQQNIVPLPFEYVVQPALADACAPTGFTKKELQGTHQQKGSTAAQQYPHGFFFQQCQSPITEAAVLVQEFLQHTHHTVARKADDPCFLCGCQRQCPKKHQQILLFDMAVQQEYQKEHNAIIQTYTGKGPQGKRHAPNQECCKQQLQRCFTLYRMAEYPPGAAEARKRQKQVYSINALCRIRPDKIPHGQEQRIPQADMPCKEKVIDK